MKRKIIVLKISFGNIKNLVGVGTKMYSVDYEKVREFIKNTTGIGVDMKSSKIICSYQRRKILNFAA